MLQTGFGRRSKSQEMARRDVIDIGHDIDHGGRAVSQGSGLVEHHGIDVGEPFHVAPLLMMMPARAA